MASKHCAVFATVFCIVAAIPGPIDLMQDAMDRKYPEIKAPFRVEAHIIRLDNPRGTTKGWMPCDIFGGTCDPKVTGKHLGTKAVTFVILASQYMI